VTGPTGSPRPRSGARPSRALGIDIGGSGIKAAVVDLRAGELVTARIREATPEPATPEGVVEVAASVIQRLEVTGELPPDMPGGAGFPGVIKDGVAWTAANLDHAWVGTSVRQLLEDRLERPILVLNDADAAGVAEVAHGAGKGQRGVVLMLTIGTGIGSALFTDGELVPNLELGHIEFHGRDVETLLSGASRERRGMSWKKWGRDFNKLLLRYEAYLWPDLIILGGGVSKELAKYQKYLATRVPVVPAAMLNTAGIVGAAMAGAAASR
jgi:polyphosphate glucokinase